MERDLTKGSITKNIAYFSLPYFLSYFLQTLYGLFDLYIIGRFGEVSDTTAVSLGGQVMHMITVIIVGLAMGVTVTVGVNFGAGKMKDASYTIGNTVTLFSILSICSTVLLLIFAPSIVAFIKTPEEAVNGTLSYLLICFAGIPFITAYNVISAVFRGLGDSKSPMYFIAAACFLNILLDLLFVGALDMGPAGAALGTTLAQTFSVIIALIFIIKQKSGIRLTPESFKFRSLVMKNILKVGFPVAVQDGFIQVSFMLITVIANQRGLNDSAAVGIVEKIISILFLVPSSMLSTVSALAAQNIGAERIDRAKKTLLYCTAFTVICGVLISVFTSIFSENTVSLFTKSKEVIRLGSQYLTSYVWDCVFAGVHFCFSGYFCASGRSGISFLHNFLAIILVRIPGAYFASASYPDTLFPMGIAAPAGSLLSVIICVIAYIWLKDKKPKVKSV